MQFINNFVYFSIIFNSFISSIIISLNGRFIGNKGVKIYSSVSMILIIICISYIFININNKYNVEIFIGSWINFSQIIDYIFIFDFLSILMTSLIFIISTFVIIYSFEYMGDEAHFIRFISNLFLFKAFMVLLVISGTIIQSFIGWEGVGLVSYLLVNFWFTRNEANRSALKAVLFNRIGDSFFILALITSFCFYGTMDILILNEIALKIIPETEIILFLILMAAIAKSAQIGFHAWLPDAMEGPTPVSSLLHSATMVTAGVYILLRLNLMLDLCDNILIMISLLGSITSLISATIALYQEDLKKIIAYSTCSQLGLLFISIGFSLYNITFFHLFIHAFFKALLFLLSGIIIHSLSGEQDLRKMGGIIKYIPLSAICFFIGNLAIMGYPFISGFYSKEILLFSLLSENKNILNQICFIIAYITSIFTIFYSNKLFYYTFVNKYRGNKIYIKYITDEQKFMSFSVIFLSLITIFLGYNFYEYFLGLGKYDYILLILRIEYINYYIKVSLFIISVLSFILLLKYKYYNLYKNMNLFLSHKWLFGSFYKLLIINFNYVAYNILFVLLDRGFFEEILSRGASILFIEKLTKITYIDILFKNQMTQILAVLMLVILLNYKFLC